MNPKKLEFSQESLAGRRHGWGSGAACGGACLLQNVLELLGDTPGETDIAERLEIVLTAGHTLTCLLSYA